MPFGWVWLPANIVTCMGNVPAVDGNAANPVPIGHQLLENNRALHAHFCAVCLDGAALVDLDMVTNI